MIIYKAIQETAASITGIKRYEAVEGMSAVNTADQRIESLTAANKYPLLSIINDDFEKIRDYAPRYRYTVNIIICTHVTDTSDQAQITDALMTAGQLAKQFMEAFEKHPEVYNSNDADGVIFSKAHRMNLGTLDDNCVGRYFTVSCFLKEPQLTCITPSSDPQYYINYYAANGYV